LYSMCKIQRFVFIAVHLEENHQTHLKVTDN
jgi:hypothetical protein